MELLQELVLTISLAVILSFLVAKLVSMAMSMSGDSGLSKCSNDPISRNASDVIFKSGGEGSTVVTSPSESKADATTSERIRHVDRLQFQSHREHPVQLDSSVEIEHIVKDMSVTAEEAVQQHFPEVATTDDFGRKSPAMEKLMEKSSGQTPEADDAISFRDQKEECDVDDTVKQRSEDKQVSSNEVSLEPSSEEEMVVQSKEIFRVDVASDSKKIVEQEKRFDDHGVEDDWEGIERTELDKVFAAATQFVDGDESKSTNERLFKIGSEVQMKMYGLQKIATEGPCREPQPMPLKISARAKWNAWQQLGNMNPEEAMEEYISLLSNRVPEWTKENSMGHGELKSTEAKPETVTSDFPDLRSSVCHQPIVKNERNLGLHADVKQDDHVAASELEVQAKE